MSKRPSITLGICLGAGLAAGIGLARPGLGTDAPAPAAASAARASASPAPAAPGYGRPATGAAAAPAAAPSANGQPANGQPATPASISIQDFAYTRGVTASPGAPLVVVNADSVAHTLTAADRSFDTGTLDSGGRATITAPVTPGTYRFVCTIHPSMTGTVTVTG